jgi:hypothetical protein
MIIHKTIPLKGLFPTLPADAKQTIIDAVFEEIDVAITVENYYPGYPACLRQDPRCSSPGEDAEYDATPLMNYGARFLSELFAEAATNPNLARVLVGYRTGDVINALYHGVNDAIVNLDMADDILHWEIEAKAEKAEYRADCEEEMKRW